jgi:hypothetical protein
MSINASPTAACGVRSNECYISGMKSGLCPRKTSGSVQLRSLQLQALGYNRKQLFE